LRLAGVRDPLRQVWPPKGHTIQETQGTNGLVQRWPRHPAGHQVNLKGADVLQIELLG